MQKVPSEEDINEVFDNILCIEDSAFKESYESGYKIGAAEENIEAFHLGYHRGAEIGAELGYYCAVVNIYLLKLQNNPGSEKIITSLKSFDEILKSFPQTNVEDVDILKLLDDIRVKFKKIRSLLKINSQFPKSDELSF